MNKINWKEILGWTETQLDEIRIAGFSYLRQGKYDIALTFFQTLVIIDPAKPYNWQTLGALHLELGRGEDAIHYLETALEMTPNHNTTLMNYCKALFMVGRKNAGLELARQLKTSPNPAIASFARALILAHE